MPRSCPLRRVNSPLKTTLAAGTVQTEEEENACVSVVLKRHSPSVVLLNPFKAALTFTEQ